MGYWVEQSNVDFYVLYDYALQDEKLKFLSEVELSSRLRLSWSLSTKLKRDGQILGNVREDNLPLNLIGAEKGPRRSPGGPFLKKQCVTISMA